MAHFAKISSDGIVERVIVIADSDTADSTGNEVESIGAAFCNRLFGGIWIQTSYTGRIRGAFAGIGYTYDADRDVFVPPLLIPQPTPEPVEPPVEPVDPPPEPVTPPEPVYSLTLTAPSLTSSSSVSFGSLGEEPQ